MVILSQAAEGNGSAEGAETSGVSPNNNPRLERPAPHEGEEIVHAGKKFPDSV